MPKLNYPEGSNSQSDTMPRSIRYKNIRQLHERISILEKQRSKQEKLIRESIKAIRNDLKPSNILKNSLRSFVGNKETRQSVLKMAAGIAISFLLKKYLGGKRGSAIAKAIDTGMQMGLSEMAFENSDKLKEIGASLLENLLPVKKRGQAESTTEE